MSNTFSSVIMRTKKLSTLFMTELLSLSNNDRTVECAAACTNRDGLLVLLRACIVKESIIIK